MQSSSSGCDCDGFRERGNELFRGKDFHGALDLYSRAIFLLQEQARDNGEKLVTLLSNRAAALLALEDYVGAVDDCTAALALNQDHTKSLSRRLHAFEKLGRLGEALVDARRIQQLDPAWPNTQQTVERLEKQDSVQSTLIKVKALIHADRLREARQHLLHALGPSGEKHELKALETELDGLYGSALRPKPGDFDILGELGEGNFSKIYKAAWKKAPEKVFAIKVIEMMTAQRMQRRHRNINNEILMEKRALNKLDHPNIVTLLATFKDYGSLYYQMEFVSGGEVFSMLQEENDGVVSAVGTHQSLARFICAQAINALEYMHRRGIVHRDIKPENMMLTAMGHLKFVDFGTAKDLFQTDLNGPEFVGTPEYMSPAAVSSRPCGFDADLWALGVVLYQLIVGTTPFSGASPYLTFLRIKRALVRLPVFVSVETQDLLQRLLTKDPIKRLCLCNSSTADKLVTHGPDLSYDALRKHPYFTYRQRDDVSTLSGFLECHTKPAVRVPKLSEICLRAVGNAAVLLADAGHKTSSWARNFDLMKLYPNDRGAIHHYLNRRNCLTSGGVLRLFFPTLVDARCIRIDPTSREYIGFTRSTHGLWGSDFFFVYMAAPHFEMNAGLAAPPSSSSSGGSDWEPELERLKQAVLCINRIRPRFVVVSGDLTHALPHDDMYQSQVEEYRKTIARISDSIPVLHLPGSRDDSGDPTIESLNAYRDRFGADYYGFWFGGVRCLMLNSTLLVSAALPDESNRQNDWLAEEIEQAKLCTTHVLIFTHHPWFLSSIEDEDSRCRTVDEISVSNFGVLRDANIPLRGQSPRHCPSHSRRHLEMRRLCQMKSWGAILDSLSRSSLLTFLQLIANRTIPKATRLKWLRRMQHHKVVFAFAGHCHRSDGGGKSFPGAAKRKHGGKKARRTEGADDEKDQTSSCTEVEEKAGSASDDETDDVAEEEGSGEEESGEESDHSESEEGKKSSSTFRNVERDFEGPTVVVTNSVCVVGQPGFRIVFVREESITHKYYALSDVPASINAATMKELP